MLGGFARLLVGADIEADDGRARGFRQRHVGFVDAADAGMDDPRGDFLGAELVERADDRLDRALHVALDHQRELLAARGLELGHHLLERAAQSGRARDQHLALLPRPVRRHFAGTPLGVHHPEPIAGFRRAAEAEHLDRGGRACGFDRGSGIADQRPHAPPLGAGDHDVAEPQRAALHQHGRDRPAAAIELRLDHGALGGTVRIGPEVENFRLQPDGLEQAVEVGLLGGGNFDVEHVAAERFHLHFLLQQLGAYPLRLGVGLVDLVDGDDHRHPGGLGVMDGLGRLRHDAVIRRHHQHDDVGHLRAAGAHGGERGVARRVDEGDLRPRGCGHLVGADVLGDAARLARGDFGRADRIEQRGLAVIDMAHDGDDRRARHQARGIVRRVEQAFFHVGFGDAADRMPHLFGQELGGIGVDHVGDLHHLPLLHQQPDHVDGALGHAHLADELVLGLVGDLALEPLHAPAERRVGALALLVHLERGDQGEPAAALLGPDPGRLGSGRGTRGPAGTAARGSRRLFLFRLERRTRAGRQCGSLGLFLAEAFLGFLLGLALGFVFVTAAIFFLALARFRGVALQPLAALAIGAPARLLLGDAAFLRLAHARVGERVGARVAFLVGEGAEHHAGRLGRRGRAQRGALHCGGARRGGFGLPRGRAFRDADRLGSLGFARRRHATLHLLDDHCLAAAVAEALTHDSLLDAAFERQRLGRIDAQRLLAGVLRFSHSSSSPERDARSKDPRAIPHP